jgi:hypothetical protein
MSALRSILIVLALAVSGPQAFAADEIADSLDKARRAYQGNDLLSAKVALDRASELLGQKHAENLAKLLPGAIGGWKAEQVDAGGGVLYAASTANRNYLNAKDENVDVQITADAGFVEQYTEMLKDPKQAGDGVKVLSFGSYRALQSEEGDIFILVANKYVVMVTGTGSPADKMAFARAVDLARLSRM